MKTFEVTLNGKQYAMLERMLCSYRARQLAMNQCINGYDLFSDILHDICAPALKFMTKIVFPEDEDYFVRQMGKKFQLMLNHHRGKRSVMRG